jgi:hypothetical protein
MRREVAIKKLGRLLGKQLGYRVDPKAPDQEARDEARLKLRAEMQRRQQLGEAVEARRTALLNADPDYQRLKAAYGEARQSCEALSAITGHYRFTVGVSNSLFFTVKAQGDSWEDVIRKLTAEAKS